MRQLDPVYVEEMKGEFTTLCETYLKSRAYSEEKYEEFMQWLEEGGFYAGPASAKYHNDFPSGLLDHTLNVYYNLRSLVHNKGLDEYISPDSIAMVALCHDLDKIGKYEIRSKNVKKYSENGSKHDNGGNYDWVVEKSWGYKERDFYYGNHEENSLYIARQYFNLTKEEEIAILHHHGGKGFDVSGMNLTPIMAKERLLTLLHIADMISTFIDEGDVSE